MHCFCTWLSYQLIQPIKLNVIILRVCVNNFQDIKSRIKLKGVGEFHEWWQEWRWILRMYVPRSEIRALAQPLVQYKKDVDRDFSFVEKGNVAMESAIKIRKSNFINYYLSIISRNTYYNNTILNNNISFHIDYELLNFIISSYKKMWDPGFDSRFENIWIIGVAQYWQITGIEISIYSYSLDEKSIRPLIGRTRVWFSFWEFLIFCTSYFSTKMHKLNNFQP